MLACLLPCREMFDIVLVSPRNYFLYTPLLPAVAAGSMEERSIVEPVRSIIHSKVGNTYNLCALVPIHSRSSRYCTGMLRTAQSPFTA